MGRRYRARPAEGPERAPHPHAQDVLDWLEDHGVALSEKRVFHHYMRAYGGDTITSCSTGQWLVLPATKGEGAHPSVPAARPLADARDLLIVVWLSLAEQWTKVLSLDGTAFGSARVRVQLVSNTDVGRTLFGKASACAAPFPVAASWSPCAARHLARPAASQGAPFNIHSKGRHIELLDVGQELHSEEVATMFSDYGLDYLEVSDGDGLWLSDSGWRGGEGGACAVA